MSRKSGKDNGKEAVLHELAELAQDRHPRNQTLIARFARCEKYQAATKLLIEALGAAGRRQSGTCLSPPPGWLPPLT
jgi:hypothetical protein